VVPLYAVAVHLVQARLDIVTEKIIETLENFKVGSTIDLKLQYSSEYAKMIELLNEFVERISGALALTQDSTALYGRLQNLEKSLNLLNESFNHNELLGRIKNILKVFAIHLIFDKMKNNIQRENQFGRKIFLICFNLVGIV